MHCNKQTGKVSNYMQHHTGKMALLLLPWHPDEWKLTLKEMLLNY